MKIIPEDIIIGSSPLITDDVTRKANQKLRYLVGPNFKFYFNEREREYELWEQRGPMFQLLLPVVVSGHKLNRISDRELKFAYEFCLRKRKNNDELYHKHKEYKKWTNPDEYVDWRPKDESKWESSSPRPEGYKKVKAHAVVN